MTTVRCASAAFRLPRWFSVAALATAGYLAAQTAAPAPKAVADDTLVLSPFEVSAGSEKGYMATETLSGTRLRTDLKDIGSSLTVFTDQMMDDLAAHGIYDLMTFAPNTDPFIMSTGDVTGNGNDFINQPTKFVTRGGASTVVAQDFFTNGVPQDRYNSESLTFTRGPNAILFGLGNAAGAFISSTKRAKFKNATSIEEQIDSRGGHRNVFDVNAVVVPDRLAIRFANLLEGLNDFRIQNNSYQRRHFLTVTFKPFKRTTVRANYEWGHLQSPAVRPWPAYDAVSPWLDAGSPLINTFTNTAAGKPAGTQNFSFTGLVSTDFSPAGQKIPTMVLLNQGQSAPTSYANGYPVNGANFRSLVRPDLYPVFASNFGNTAYRLTDYRVASVFLEQQVTKDLFVEAAVNSVHNYTRALNGFVGQLDYIYVDPNKQLPNGAANPNVGMLYAQAQSTLIEAPSDATNYRLMTSYSFDFARHFSNWAKYLGRHEAALFLEQDDSSGWSSNNNLFNATPLATTGPASKINNGANLLQYRYYFDPAANKVGTSAGRRFESFPVLYANDPVPQAGPNGITPAFVAQQGPTVTEAIVKTKAVALQSFFWNDRIVLTNGVRHDDQVSWLASPSSFTNFRDSNLIFPRGSNIDLRTFAPQSRVERGGSTRTLGVVVHALPWLSFSYNTSDNFQVNTGTRNIFGDLLPNPKGKGSDYGMKLSLLDRRLFVELTYYTNQSIDTADSISANAAGNFKQFDLLWQTVGQYTGDAKYLTYPYSSLSTVWADVVSTRSTGWESTVTANLTPAWRLMVNGSVRSNLETSPRGRYVNEYIAQYVPVIQSHPEWMALTEQDGLTVAQHVADILRTQTNFNAIRNSPSANFAAKWTMNVITTYELPWGGWLKGFSVGGSANVRGRAIAGFSEDANQVFDPTRPYYAPSYANYGAWISYRRRIFHNKVDWRLQMNVRNLFDDNTLYPLVIVDSRDGKHTPSTAIYNLREPRTYVFTSSFKF